MSNVECLVSGNELARRNDRNGHEAGNVPVREPAFAMADQHFVIVSQFHNSLGRLALTR